MNKSLLLLFLGLACASARVITGKYTSVTIGDQLFDVMKYGAKGDGKTDDTAAIQKAFAAAKAANGGTVVLTAGKTFLTKAIAFQSSNTALRVSTGATLLASNVRSSWPSGKHIITIQGFNNVAIEGAGTLDGQGAEWWKNGMSGFRPKFLYASKVNGLILKESTWKNSPEHFLQMFSDRTEIFGITMRAPASTGIANPSHNTDGIDVHGNPFWVHNCDISVGDDNVALHENDTIVEDCTFGTGHGASIGSLCDDWLQNIIVRNIKFTGTTAGARIKTIPNCAGGLKNVWFQDLTMTNVGTPIEVSMFYTSAGKGTGSKTTFKISNINFKNIVSTNPTKTAGKFLCSPSSPCYGIHMTNVKQTGSKLSYTCSYAHGDAVAPISPASCLLK